MALRHLTLMLMLAATLVGSNEGLAQPRRVSAAVNRSADDACPGLASGLPAGFQLLACRPVSEGTSSDRLILDRIELAAGRSQSVRRPSGTELIFVQEGEVVFFDAENQTERTYAAQAQVLVTGDYALRNDFGGVTTLLRARAPRLEAAGGVPAPGPPKVGNVTSDALIAEPAEDIGIQPLLAGSGPADLFIARGTWRPGDGLPLHSHPGTVGVVVESGALEFGYSWNGVDRQGGVLNAGQNVLFASDTAFAASNTSEEPVTFLLVGVISSDRPPVAPVPGTLAYSIKRGQHWDIYAYDFLSGASTQLTDRRDSDEWAPAYSHDGSRLAYLSDAGDGSNQVWLMNPDGSDQRQVTSYREGTIRYVAWGDGDGNLLLTVENESSSQLMFIWLDETGDGPRPLDMGTSAGYATVPTSTGGATLLAFVGQENGDFDVLLRRDGTIVTIAGTDSPEDAPNFNPRAGWLAYQIGALGERRVMVVRVETAPWEASGTRGEPVPVSGSGGEDSNPVWSPDGSSLAYVGGQGEEATIWIEPLQLDSTTDQVRVGDAVRLDLPAHDELWYLSWRR